MRSVFIALILLSLFGCDSPKNEVRRSAEITNVKYARNFRLITHGDFVELQLLRPDDGVVEAFYALVDRRKSVRIPTGMTEIKVPVKNLAALSTTHIGMLSAIGKLGVIKATTDARYIASEKILKGISSGKISAYPDESAVSPARLVTDEIDLVMYSGFGGEFPNNSKLSKLGIRTMANYDWREQHPLGKAEWIKVFGCLTGTEDKAAAYFAEVEKEYEHLRKTARIPASGEKMLAGSLIGDIWFAPAGESYMARIFRDAGADYIYKDEPGTGSCEKALSKVLRDQQNCKKWLNPGAASLNDLAAQNEKYALFDAVRTGEVYCYTHKVNYFWEMAAVNPHWLLSDLVSILGTGEKSELRFYKRLS
jgi:iron complex transport system substrate-binding protein